MVFEYLNTVDYIIFGLSMLAAISGALKGLIEIISKYMGIIAGFILAFMFTKMLSGFVLEKLHLGLFISTYLSYFAIFMAGYVLLKWLGNIVSQIAASVNLSVLDRVLGFFLCLIVAIAIESIVIDFFAKQSLFDLSSNISGSFLNNNLLIPVRSFILSNVESLK